MIEYVIYFLLWVLIFVFYLILRVKWIQNEIKITWKIKKRGILEMLIKDLINEDIERQKKDIEQAKEKKDA